MIVADVHNHTNASHGKASVGEMYAAAKDRGLAVYGFSEHSPRPEAYSYPVEYREHLRQNFVRYASEVMQLRALSGSPKVLLGMELDWFPSERPFMEAAVAAYPFDYIIGGIHFLGSWGFDFTQDDWKISPQQCYTRYENYFRTLADMARRRPQTMEEFLSVSGVGEVKARKYGAAFLAVLARAEKEEV